MRILIIFLLLANVLYYFWSQTIGNTTYVVPPMTKAGIPTIQLLPTKNNDAYKSQNSSVQSSCYTFGPFSSEKSAQFISNKINDFGLATKTNKQKTMQVLNFLVYLDALPSRSEAEKVVEDIRKNKITDTMIIETGPYTNAIALGSFADLDKARRHAEYVIFLGYAAKYTEQKIKKEVFWIKYDEPFSSNAPVLKWAKEIDPLNSAQKIPMSCEL